MRRKSQREDQVDGERVVGKALTACASPALETGDGWWSVPMECGPGRQGPELAGRLGSYGKISDGPWRCLRHSKN